MTKTITTTDDDHNVDGAYDDDSKTEESYSNWLRGEGSRRRPRSRYGLWRATISQRVGLGASPQVEALVYRSNNRSVVYRRVWTAPQCATGDDTLAPDRNDPVDPGSPS